jgi:hypothetical protein
MAVRLFLSLELDTAFHKIDIVCSLFRVRGQIFAQKADVQASQPNRTGKQGRRLCILRLRRRNPSLQRWLFHEFQVSAESRQAPKLYVRYVRRQFGVWFENQGQ